MITVTLPRWEAEALAKACDPGDVILSSHTTIELGGERLPAASVTAEPSLLADYLDGMADGGAPARLVAARRRAWKIGA